MKKNLESFKRTNLKYAKNHTSGVKTRKVVSISTGVAEVGRLRRKLTTTDWLKANERPVKLARPRDEATVSHRHPIPEMEKKVSRTWPRVSANTSNEDSAGLRKVPIPFFIRGSKTVPEPSPG